jgi:DNA-binding PadR family transcriptional regulator
MMIKNMVIQTNTTGNRSPTEVNSKNEDFDSLPKISPTEELILLLLHNHECYGLQITKAIEKATQGQKKLNVGSLYPTLDKLEKKGLITSYWGDERRKERGGARRRYYQITEKGRATCKVQQDLRNKLREWKSAFS